MTHSFELCLWIICSENNNKWISSGNNRFLRWMTIFSKNFGSLVWPIIQFDIIIATICWGFKVQIQENKVDFWALGYMDFPSTFGIVMVRGWVSWWSDGTSRTRQSSTTTYNRVEFIDYGQVGYGVFKLGIQITKMIWEVSD